MWNLEPFTIHAIDYENIFSFIYRLHSNLIHKIVIDFPNFECQYMVK